MHNPRFLHYCCCLNYFCWLKLMIQSDHSDHGSFGRIEPRTFTIATSAPILFTAVRRGAVYHYIRILYRSFEIRMLLLSSILTIWTSFSKICLFKLHATFKLLYFLAKEAAHVDLIKYVFVQLFHSFNHSWSVICQWRLSIIAHILSIYHATSGVLYTVQYNIGSFQTKLRKQM